MDWFFALMRMAGACFPASAFFVQLQAEVDRVDSKRLADRVRSLEDPISSLHEDVPKVAQAFYDVIRREGEPQVWFDEQFYWGHSEVLALLEAKAMIAPQHGIGDRYSDGILIVDPSFIMYMCALCEPDDTMQLLYERVNACPPGEWLNGKEMATELDLPIPVVRACFQVFAAKGLGQVSNLIPSCLYTGKA